jgi:hypothetical protein
MDQVRPSTRQLAEQGIDGLLASEEQTGILFPEWQQAAIRAQNLAHCAGVGGRLAAQTSQQQLELSGVGEVGAEIDPGLQAQEAAGRIFDLR